MKEYFMDKRINASLLKIWLNESPFRAQWLMNNSKHSEAMKTGTLVHEMLEHKGEIPKQIVLSPFEDYRTKEAKSWRDDQINLGLTPLKTSELEKIKEMSRMVWESCPKFIKNVLQDDSSIRENAVYTDKYKSLEDLYNKKEKVIIDYKTTCKTTESQIIKEIYKFNYDLQAAFYMDNHEEAEKFIFVFVSSVEPYEVFVFQCKASFLKHGQKLYKDALKKMELGVSNKVILDLDAPLWAAIEDEDDF